VIYLECPIPDRHDPGRFLFLLGNSDWTERLDRYVSNGGNTTTICRMCGHTNGMHDERGCVVLNCSCDRTLPTPKNVIRFIQPARGPLNVRRNPLYSRSLVREFAKDRN
jgi:hypothetical protein